MSATEPVPTTEADFRVLLIDDDAVTRDGFARSMSWRRIAVDAVESEADARALLARGGYPVVVSDYVLADGDGLNLIARLHEEFPDVAFVLITGNALDLPEHAVADRVTFAVLEKPWDNERAADVLRRARTVHHERRDHLEGRSGEERTALLIEDNPGDAELMLELIDALDVSPVCVKRLDQALEILRTRSFPLVLTDLTLPDARGLDAVMRLRAAAPDAAIVVTSGLPADVERQVFRVGAQEFINKADLGVLTLGPAVSRALERKQVERQLIQMAHRDPLTGLGNRTMLTEQMTIALARCHRTRARCALLFIDLDGFKPVNDTHGHNIGDALLRHIASRIALEVREYDLAARLGGDEFAVLLTDVQDSETALRIGERIREAVAAPVTIEGREIQVGASIGVAMATAEVSGPTDFLEAADRAMYAAKRQGKNAVVLGEGSEPQAGGATSGFGAASPGSDEAQRLGADSAA